MHWKHTCVYRSMQVSAFLRKPHPLSSSQDHPRRNFPRTISAAKAEPVLVSGKILKNLKFPPLCTNLHKLLHFYLEFLKDFYIFRIHGPSGSLWHPWIQDSSSINREIYCPQEMVVSIQFLLHSNLCDSLINNIKTFSVAPTHAVKIQYKAPIENNRIQPDHTRLTAGTSCGSIKGPSHLQLHISDE